MSEIHNWRTASEEEIRSIIAKVAAQSHNGYFYDSEVKRALEAEGILPKSAKYERIIGSMFHIDAFGPKKQGESRMPRNINDPVKPVIEAPEGPLMLGAPDLGIKPISQVVHAEYRPGGVKIGGISPKPPMGK